jgi:hypothetical protein
MAAVVVDTVVIKVESTDVASSAERFEIASAVASSPEVPEAKRQRADRSISPMQVDTAMATMSAEGADDHGYHTPSTPVRAGLAPLCRKYMAEMFDKFASLLQPLQDSIPQAVQAAIQPLQAEVLSITRRLEQIEQRIGAGSEGSDQPGGWSGWHDYDQDYGRGYDQDFGKDYVPIEPTWAERAARVGKGAGKSAAGPAARGPRSASAGAGARPPAVSRPVAAAPGKIRIYTLGGARVKLEDVKATVCAFLSEHRPQSE